jgi:hypothetical protein
MGPKTSQIKFLNLSTVRPISQVLTTEKWRTSCFTVLRNNNSCRGTFFVKKILTPGPTCKKAFVF